MMALSALIAAGSVVLPQGLSSVFLRSLYPLSTFSPVPRDLRLACSLAVLLSLCVVFETSSHIPSWPATHYVVKDNLKFLIPLPLPTKCWHGRRELSCCSKPGLYPLYLPTEFSYPGEDCPDSKLALYAEVLIAARSGGVVQGGTLPGMGGLSRDLSRSGSSMRRNGRKGKGGREETEKDRRKKRPTCSVVCTHKQCTSCTHTSRAMSSHQHLGHTLYPHFLHPSSELLPPVRSLASISLIDLLVCFVLE